MPELNIGEYITEKCRQANIPANAIAFNGGFSQTMLSRLKNGERQPSPEMLRNIERGAGIIVRAMEEIRVAARNLLPKGPDA